MLGREGQEPGLLGVSIFTAVLGRKSSMCSCFHECFFKGLGAGRAFLLSNMLRFFFFPIFLFG